MPGRNLPLSTSHWQVNCKFIAATVGELQWFGDGLVFRGQGWGNGGEFVEREHIKLMGRNPAQPVPQGYPNNGYLATGAVRG